MIGEVYFNNDFHEINRLINVTPFLWLKLAEESSEVAQAILKSLSKNANGKNMITDKIYLEIADFINCVNLLIKSELLNESMLEKAINKKQNKILEKYKVDFLDYR